MVSEKEYKGCRVRVNGDLYKVDLKLAGNRGFVTMDSRSYEVIFPGGVDKESPFNARVNDRPYKLKLNKMDDDGITLDINGRTHRVKIMEGSSPSIQRRKRPSIPQPTLRPKEKEIVYEKGAVKASMSGIISGVYVKKGDRVEADQKLYTLNAMKMENEVTATKTGTVKEVRIKEGKPVSSGEVVMLIE